MEREKLKADILRYLDSDLTPDEERTLAAQIRGNKEAEDLFAELMRFNGNIATVLSEAAGEKQARRDLRVQRPVTAGAPTTWILVAAGIAAAILIAVLMSGGEEPLRKPKPAPLVKKEEPREVLPPPKSEPMPEAPKPPPPPPRSKPEPKAEPLPEPPKPPPDPPKPEPKSEPEPPKPEPRPEPPRTTTKVEVTVATLESFKGDATVQGEKAKEGQAILAGLKIETGVESAAALKLADGTKIELAAETRVAQITNGDGKKIALDLGALTAEVKKQPAGQPLVITTPHAEARVLGTRFTLAVKGDTTRLEVQEGRVRLTRLSDKSFVDVGAGSFAMAAPGPRPAAKKIPALNPRLLLNEEFDALDRWQPLTDGFTTTTKGKVEIDLSPKTSYAYAQGEWHLPGGVRLKQGFAVPFKVTVDVEVSAKHDNLNALVVLVPASAKTGGIKNEVAARLRGGDYTILVENTKGKPSPAGTFPIKTQWVIELDKQDVKFWAGGKLVGSQAHGLSMTEPYTIELQGAAKKDVPNGAKITFDNVKVELIDR
jgi:ferric-dicitrate binding protein FerR (iron transport regulator)